MIIIDLACNLDHPFEGWFKSLDVFDNQRESGMISCPSCGSSEIHRVPSVVHVGKTSAGEAEVVPAPPGVTTNDIHAAFHQLMTVILSGSEDVGKDFTQEARKIHYMEAPLRSIRGEASVEDFETLREEGIDVLLLPSIKKIDLN
jgi:hypothetical protein